MVALQLEAVRRHATPIRGINNYAVTYATLRRSYLFQEKKTTKV